MRKKNITTKLHETFYDEKIFRTKKEQPILMTSLIDRKNLLNNFVTINKILKLISFLLNFILVER